MRLFLKYWFLSLVLTGKQVPLTIRFTQRWINRNQLSQGRLLRVRKQTVLLKNLLILLCLMLLHRRKISLRNPVKSSRRQLRLVRFLKITRWCSRNVNHLKPTYSKACSVTVSSSWKVQPKFTKFVICYLCQSSPSLSILVPLCLSSLSLSCFSILVD